MFARIVLLSLLATSAHAAVFSDEADYTCTNRGVSPAGRPSSRGEVLNLTLWSNGSFKFSSSQADAADCEGRFNLINDGYHPAFRSGPVNVDRENCLNYGGAGELQGQALGNESTMALPEKFVLSIGMTFQTYFYNCKQTNRSNGWL